MSARSNPSMMVSPRAFNVSMFYQVYNKTALEGEQTSTPTDSAKDDPSKRKVNRERRAYFFLIPLNLLLMALCFYLLASLYQDPLQLLLLSLATTSVLFIVIDFFMAQLLAKRKKKMNCCMTLWLLWQVGPRKLTNELLL